MSAAKVLELSARRDEVKRNHKGPGRELTEKIVGLKYSAKKLTEGSPERKKLEAEIATLSAERAKLGRSPGLDAVMVELREARLAAAEEAVAGLLVELEKLSDEELEKRHHALMAKRAALKPELVIVSGLRSRRARVSANKELLKDLTAEEILASLTPEQRAALVKSA